jgi:anti-anti-sigma factor
MASVPSHGAHLAVVTVMRGSSERRIRVLGEIDMSNAGEVLAHFSSATEPHDPLPAGGRMLVDLTRVEFIDSAGVSALLRFSYDKAASGHPLTYLVDRVGPVIHTLRAAGVDGLLPLTYVPAGSGGQEPAR